jgi:hypothetical protein
MAQSLQCSYCGKTFNAKRASAVYCSDSCRVRASRDRNYLCFYCGDRANQRDHVIPHWLTGDKVRHWSGVDVVECCIECNGILSGEVFDTMAERVQYLARKFRIKHRLSIAKVEWSEEELMELRGSLRTYVASREHQYWQRWSRLQYMRTRAAQLAYVERQD